MKHFYLLVGILNTIGLNKAKTIISGIFSDKGVVPYISLNVKYVISLTETSYNMLSTK